MWSFDSVKGKGRNSTTWYECPCDKTINNRKNHAYGWGRLVHLSSRLQRK